MRQIWALIEVPCCECEGGGDPPLPQPVPAVSTPQPSAPEAWAKATPPGLSNEISASFGDCWSWDSSHDWNRDC